MASSVVIIDAAAAQETCNCIHCALRTTLVAVCSFHNGNILVHHEGARSVLRRCRNLPHSPFAGSTGLTGVRKMSSRFTQFILVAMALGIVMGAAIFNFLPDSRVELAADINLIAMLFLRLIKMIIAPLVFATLVGGIAHMGSGAKLGRIFAKTMGWFVSASFVSLLLGLLMVNLLQPGANFPGTLPDKTQSTGLPVSAFSIEKFLTHLIPTSIADAMAQNEILQIVVFAVFFAVALGAAARARQADHGADRRPRPYHAQGHGLCDAVRAGRGVGGDHGDGGQERPAGAVEAHRLHGRLLSLAHDPVGHPGRGRLHRDRAALQPSAAADPRAADDRVLDRDRRKPPIRRRWRASTASAPRRGSRPSCCRSAIPSTSTAR